MTICGKKHRIQNIELPFFSFHLRMRQKIIVQFSIWSNIGYVKWQNKSYNILCTMKNILYWSSSMGNQTNFPLDCAILLSNFSQVLLAFTYGVISQEWGREVLFLAWSTHLEEGVVQAVLGRGNQPPLAIHFHLLFKNMIITLNSGKSI